MKTAKIFKRKGRPLGLPFFMLLVKVANKVANIYLGVGILSRPPPTSLLFRNVPCENEKTPLSAYGVRSYVKFGRSGAT